MLQLFKVDTLKEGMIHKFDEAKAAQTGFRVFLQESSNELLAFLADLNILRESQLLVFLDSTEHCSLILLIKGRLSHQ